MSLQSKAARGRGAGGLSRLLADPEPRDELRVALGVLTFEVVEEPSPLTDELQEPSTRMVVFGVNLEMIGEVTDALTENRDLYLR